MCVYVYSVSILLLYLCLEFTFLCVFIELLYIQLLYEIYIELISWKVAYGEIVMYTEACQLFNYAYKCHKTI